MSNPSSVEAPGKKPAPRPRDAATLIIVDRTGAEPRIVMGQRRMDQVFMPGKFVFPGGRVDKEDRLAISADDLRSVEVAKLLVGMKGSVSSSRARALALAAVRETFEEAGLVIGAPDNGAITGSAPANWQPFYAHGFRPSLSPLTFFARAITPPGRPRRYDTRFFCVEATAIGARLDQSDGELSGVHWVSLDDARKLDLPSITSVIIEELTDRLKQDQLDDPSLPVPFYHHRNGSFRRDLIHLPDETSS